MSGNSRIISPVKLKLLGSVAEKSRLCSQNEAKPQTVSNNEVGPLAPDLLFFYVTEPYIMNFTKLG